MRNISQIKAGALLTYVTVFFNAVIAVFYTPFLANMLGQSEFGLYSLVMSFMAYLTILDFGFGDAIIVYLSKCIAQNKLEQEQSLNGMFLLIYFGIGLFSLLVGLAIYMNVDLIFSSSLTVTELEEMKVLLIILTINMFLTFPLSVFTNIIVAHEKFIANKCLNILRIILNPIIMTPFLLFGYKSITLIILVTIINLFVNLLNMFYCFIKIKIQISFKPVNSKLLREILVFSFFIFLNQVVYRINWSLDNIIIGAICGTTVVAVYTVAFQFGQAYMAISTAINSVLLPKISKMEANNASPKEFSDLFILTGRIQAFILFVFLTGFILFGRQLIMYLYGSDYLDAYLFAVILLIPITIPFLQCVGINILEAKNKNQFRTLVYFAIAIINVVFSVLVAKDFGGLGTVTVTAIAIFMGHFVIMNIYYSKKIKLDIGRFWKEIFRIIIPIIILFCISWLIILLINSSNVFVYVLEIVVYFLLYSVVCWKFTMNNKEKCIIKNMIIRK